MMNNNYSARVINTCHRRAFHHIFTNQTDFRIGSRRMTVNVKCILIDVATSDMRRIYVANAQRQLPMNALTRHLLTIE